MAMGAEMARPFPAAGGDDEVSTAWAVAPVFLAAETNQAVDPVIWADEKRMKRELLAWAKAMASMAAAGKNTSSTAPRYRRRGRP
ncbi:hypothetical protein SETIT_4G091300v2 [Setaria italica]|uniref:Uncharacterized protein n=1 Tax=Setaria italica TaxID=4555 RepID=K3Y0G0_SETIT|nr:hypothetical protein SETIT_4G091300v2 [Setaria italica]